MSRRTSYIWACIAGALAILLLALLYWWANAPRPGEQYIFVVPPGAGATVGQGQDVGLPSTIELVHGRSTALIIRNEDSQPVQVGPVRVEPGQTVTLPYRSRGTYDLVCTVHASGNLRIIVK